MAESIVDVPLFSSFPTHFRAVIETAMVERTLKPGSVLFNQGDRVGGTEGLYVLRAGSVTVSVKRPTGGFAVLRTMEPGEVVGIIGLIDPKSTRQATVVAGAACRVAHLDRAAFLTVIHSDPKLACAFRLVLARQLTHDLRQVDAALRAAVTREDETVELRQIVRT
jgi:CRP-like cAMP-binding protein